MPTVLLHSSLIYDHHLHATVLLVGGDTRRSASATTAQPVSRPRLPRILSADETSPTCTRDHFLCWLVTTALGNLLVLRRYNKSRGGVVASRTFDPRVYP